MTNNEPLSGNLKDDGNANGTASSAAHPVGPGDVNVGAPSTGQYDDVDFVSGDAQRGTSADRVGSGTDALAGGADGVGDGTTGLTTPATGTTGGSDAAPARGNLGDLGDPAHPFDQTNGIVEGLQGDSDEADAGDTTLP